MLEPEASGKLPNRSPPEPPAQGSGLVGRQGREPAATTARALGTFYHSDQNGSFTALVLPQGMTCTSAKDRPFHLAPVLKGRDPPRGVEEEFLDYSETNLERSPRADKPDFLVETP